MKNLKGVYFFIFPLAEQHMASAHSPLILRNFIDEVKPFQAIYTQQGLNQELWKTYCFIKNILNSPFGREQLDTKYHAEHGCISLNFNADTGRSLKIFGNPLILAIKPLEGGMIYLLNNKTKIGGYIFVGLTAEELRRLFEPFEVDGPVRQFPITRAYIAQHGEEAATHPGHIVFGGGQSKPKPPPVQNNSAPVGKNYSQGTTFTNRVDNKTIVDGAHDRENRATLKVSNSRIAQYQAMGYKKAEGLVNGQRVPCIIKLGLLAESRIASPPGEKGKCRTDVVHVLAIARLDHVGRPGEGRYLFDLAEAYALHDNSFVYTLGKTIREDKFVPDLNLVCVPGIHFFWNQVQALSYNSPYVKIENAELMEQICYKESFVDRAPPSEAPRETPREAPREAPREEPSEAPLMGVQSPPPIVKSKDIDLLEMLGLRRRHPKHD